MKLRIIKRYGYNGRGYYIVQQKKLFWWGVPWCSLFHYHVINGPNSYKNFDTYEDAKKELDKFMKEPDNGTIEEIEINKK